MPFPTNSRSGKGAPWTVYNGGLSDGVRTLYAEALIAEAYPIFFRNEAKTPGVTATTVMKGGLQIPCEPTR